MRKKTIEKSRGINTEKFGGNKMGNKIGNKGVWILGALLAIAVVYIAITTVQASMLQQQQEQLIEQQSILQQGVQIGYQQAVVQILQQGATCQPVPVTFENATLNMIAVECLQGGAQQ